MTTTSTPPPLRYRDRLTRRLKRIDWREVTIIIALGFPVYWAVIDLWIRGS